jgi:hypothetical protein
MVVVGITTHSVHGFAIFAEDQVNVSRCAKCLQSAIHRGKSNAVASSLQVLVDLLGGTEVV